MKEKGVREKENQDLELNKLSVEEVRARNRELAQMKSILFYQEKKNKRINKIKSKKYRKIHKKAEEKRKAEEREVLFVLPIIHRLDAETNRSRALPRTPREGRAQASPRAHVAEAQEHLQGGFRGYLLSSSG